MADYIVNTVVDTLKMLKASKVKDIEELFCDIPSHLRANKLKLSDGFSQLEVERKLSGYADDNKVYKTILRGAGAYNYYIPPVVDYLAGRSEFVTAYTPYQPELSQGILQSIFEYQTMICNLIGMDVSNASLYDGANAAAEAIVMCLNKGQNKVIISSSVNPDTLNVLKTRLKPLGAEIVFAKSLGKTNVDDIKSKLDESIAAVYLEQPNYYGIIEDTKEIGELLSSSKANYILGINPLSLPIVLNPRDVGADIVVGEGQPLGNPLSFGGPYLGFIAVKEKFVRKMPGRIVGETIDNKGRRAFVLTLQAREQHIRREKALSNICSNQALCALRASIYLAAFGSQGIKEVAEQCMSKAHYAKDAFIATGVMEEVYPDEFFHEFVLLSKVPVDIILNALEREGILGGLKIDDDKILWCVTELVTKQEILRAAEIIKGAGNGINI